MIILPVGSLERSEFFLILIQKKDSLITIESQDTAKWSDFQKCSGQVAWCSLLFPLTYGVAPSPVTPSVSNVIIIFFATEQLFLRHPAWRNIFNCVVDGRM
jgi:hypothetical protein